MLEALERRLFLSHAWFVSPLGNDSYPGTIVQPFKTISHAAALAQPGDTVYLRGGTYHETVKPTHSGYSGEPITYAAYADEQVTIDGADPIAGWNRYGTSGHIYWTQQNWDLGAGKNQLFVDGVAMNEAQWPNTAVGAVAPATSQVQSVYTSAIGNAWQYSDTATITDSSLPGGPGYWNGATIHIGMGQGWVVQTGTVLSSGYHTLTFAYQHQTSYETPAVGNHFYLTGLFKGLDGAGEWYRDPATGRLYLWTRSGDNPASHVVEAKHRQYAFDLSGLAYINVLNIRIVASSIDTNFASNHINLTGISASYVSQQSLFPIGWVDNSPGTGIIVQGYDNVLQNSTITYSSGNGVFLGGTNNTVQNCTIAYTDRAGVDQSGITVVGTQNRILSNVIHDTGRDGIRNSDATRLIIEYNTIYNIANQTTDAGAIYDFGTNSLGTVIAYNTIYRISAGGYGAAAIYLDNGSQNYVVHNNNISNCQLTIKPNPPNYNDNIYNNTINGKLVSKINTIPGGPGSTPFVFRGGATSLTVLGTLGGFRSFGNGINASGQVVGNSYTGSAQPAMLYSAGRLFAIDPFGTSDDAANAINAAGQIVGEGYQPSGQQSAFIYAAGRVTSIGTLGGDVGSNAWAINTAGQVVGVSYNAVGRGMAFLYSGGRISSLGTLGGSVSQATGINDAGEVVGAATLAGDRDAHAFAWLAGKMLNLGTLGGASSYATAVNKAGQVVGAAMTGGNQAIHAFIYTGGRMHDLGALYGYRNSVATGIDSAGDVVGYAYNSDLSTPHAFLYRNGRMYDLNTLIPQRNGWTITAAAGINDHNQITGTAINSGLSRGYVLALG